MARAHGLGRFAEPVAQSQNDELEQNRFGNLKHRPHGQDRDLCILIIRHGLRRNDGQDIRQFGSR